MSSHYPEIRRLLSGRIYIIAAVIVISCSGAYLWEMFNPGLLATGFNGQVSMKANTAAGFITAGFALLLARIQPRYLQAFCRWLLALPLLLLGLLTLSQYIFQINLHFDEILFNAPNREVLTSSPGRMSPISAIGFVLFAIAMVIDHWQTGNARGWSRAIATVLMLLALTSLLGYAYSAPELYMGIDDVTAMSLLASILFLLLGVGVVWIRAEFGLTALIAEQSVVGTHIRALVPMVVGAPILVGAAVAAGYGSRYEGPFAIALTSLGSVIAASLVAAVSIVLLRRAEGDLYVKDRALDATTNGVVITDHAHPNEPITFVNDAFLKITGYPEEESIGRNCRFLNQGADNDPETLAELRKCINDARKGTFELQNVRRDGSKFWNRLSVAPVADYEGKVTHFLGIMNDVTDKYEQQARLSKALDEARTANEMRNTFVRLAGHELRTPLNAAMTWIRLMEVDDSVEIREKGLNVIAQSIESQSRLIDDLVDVTRFAAAGVRLENEDVDVAEIVAASTEELRPTIEPGQTLVVDIDDGDYSAHVDPLRMQQIVRNLVTNANKYTPADGRIDVHMEADEQRIQLTVTDNGKGLSDDDIDSIFKPFWRADSNQPGLGVGLAIVSALVTAHSGTITVQSDGAGMGSSFRVQIPRRAQPDDAEIHTEDVLGASGSYAAAVDPSQA